ncbi:DUF420 domain-containing protein [Planctomicrobium sp.]|jgi:protein SCO1|nr:DUF420 domain-containing protein [Planctomicrobium sp.]MDB4733575.1 DUF420 domain-containing protein [Planctomicrobium sp.]
MSFLKLNVSSWIILTSLVCVVTTSIAQETDTQNAEIVSELPVLTEAEIAEADKAAREQERTLSPEETPPPTYRTSQFEQPRLWDPQEVADFTLLDQTGQEFSNKDLLGEAWIVNFVFAQCSYQCPLTSRTMMEFNKTIEDVDLKMVTITVNPEEDTVDIMSKYAEIWGADPERWIFATGEPENVWKLIREGFKITAWENVGTAREPGMEFAHDNNIIHISSEGKILGRYNSTDPKEMSVLRTVLKGKRETPEEYRPVERKIVKSIPKDPLEKLPNWARRLPATNAMLNALATLLLVLGYSAIKAKMAGLHKKMMLYAFGVSCAFLVSYLSYHFALHHYADVRGKPFEHTGPIKTVYFSILISHVFLAALVPVLAVVTIVKGLRQNWDSHKRWARVTFPIWLYVSITGVIIYWMLYKL